MSQIISKCVFVVLGMFAVGIGAGGVLATTTTVYTDVIDNIGTSRLKALITCA